MSKDFINIKWQEGPIQEKGENGAQIEEVIELLINRLKGFQTGNFPCEENNVAIKRLIDANVALEERTKKRREQGVEGYKLPHE